MIFPLSGLEIRIIHFYIHSSTGFMLENYPMGWIKYLLYPPKRREKSTHPNPYSIISHAKFHFSTESLYWKWAQSSQTWLKEL